MKTRIIHNGLKYRVEVLHLYRFLWWRWEKWKPLYIVRHYPYDSNIVAEFITSYQAKAAMHAYRAEQTPRPWRVVEQEPQKNRGGQRQ